MLNSKIFLFYNVILSFGYCFSHNKISVCIRSVFFMIAKYILNRKVLCIFSRHEDLRHAFGKFGRIVDVTVPVNYHTGRPKGFAFVEYPFKIMILSSIFYAYDRSFIFP